MKRVERHGQLAAEICNVHLRAMQQCMTFRAIPFERVQQLRAGPGIIQAIDERFASSENPTRTQTEAAFAQMFTDMLGNVQAYIRNIGLAVVFSLSVVAANAMAMSMVSEDPRLN